MRHHKRSVSQVVTVVLALSKGLKEVGTRRADASGDPKHPPSGPVSISLKYASSS